MIIFLSRINTMLLLTYYCCCCCCCSAAAAAATTTATTTNSISLYIISPFPFSFQLISTTCHILSFTPFPLLLIFIQLFYVIVSSSFTFFPVSLSSSYSPLLLCYFIFLLSFIYFNMYFSILNYWYDWFILCDKLNWKQKRQHLTFYIHVFAVFMMSPSLSVSQSLPGIVGYCFI